MSFPSEIVLRLARSPTSTSSCRRSSVFMPSISSDSSDSARAFGLGSSLPSLGDLGRSWECHTSHLGADCFGHLLNETCPALEFWMCWMVILPVPNVYHVVNINCSHHYDSWAISEDNIYHGTRESAPKLDTHSLNLHPDSDGEKLLGQVASDFDANPFARHQF